MTTDKKPTPAPVMHARLVSVTFGDSVSFLGELTSAQAGRNVDDILPGQLKARGVVDIDSPTPTGVLLRKAVGLPGGPGHHVAQHFVPMSNVRGFGYGE